MSGRDDVDAHDGFFGSRPATTSGRPTARSTNRSATALVDRPVRRAAPTRSKRPRRAQPPRQPSVQGRRKVAPARRTRAVPAPRALRSLAGPLDGDTARRRTHRRLIAFVLAVVVAAAGIGAKLTDLQITDRDRWVTYGARQREGFRNLPAGRGGIFDRNAQAFALSIAQPDVVADPRAVTDPLAAAKALAPVLGVPQATLLGKLTETNRYQVLASTVAPRVAAAARRLGLPGITFEDQYLRRNPSDDLARGIIGHTYADGRVDQDGHQGQSGFERAYEDELRGEPGKLFFEKGVGGVTIAGGEQKLEAAKPGTSLYLTLDQSLQYATEQALSAQVQATGASQAMAIISRPSTGEILSMASVAAGEDGTVANTDDNRTVSNVFEPGSVNKMITLAGAMEEGQIDPETVLTVPDNLLVADKRFTDHDPHPTADWSATDILVTSSNIGTIKIAQQLGPDKLDHYLRAFGFGRSSGLPTEVNGIMLPVDQWSGTSLGSIAIGQGISVTALQMLAAYNVVANDGVYVAPKLVGATDDGTGRVETRASAPRRVVSAETATNMAAMLSKVVADGTGKPAAIQGYQVAGKTGTARIPQPAPHLNPDDAYQDAQGRYHYQSGFVGFVAGADLSIIVTVQDAQTSIYGSEVAAPLFAQLGSLALRREQIPPPALALAARASVPELSPSAREIDGEDPGLVTGTTQG